MEIFECFAQNDTAGSRFDRLMGKTAAAISAGFVSAYDFSTIRTFVDVGGGSGALATAILQATPHSRGTIFDLPDVI